jgi:hypothetical protein
MPYARDEMQDMREESRFTDRLKNGDFTLLGVRQRFFYKGLHRRNGRRDVGDDFPSSLQPGVITSV